MCFQPKVTLKKVLLCLMLPKALIQMFITGLENALKYDCSAYSTVYSIFILMIKISVLIACSVKESQANNFKKQQKFYLVLMYLAVICM